MMKFGYTIIYVDSVAETVGIELGFVTDDVEAAYAKAVAYGASCCLCACQRRDAD